jgi:hypothetical protein
MDEEVVHKVYRSEDAGETSSNWTDGLTGLNSYRIRFIEGSESSVLVATQDGLYYRNNALPYWVPLNRGFPKIAIRDFELDYDNRKIYAGSYGSGLWLLEMSEDMWTL